MKECEIIKKLKNIIIEAGGLKYFLIDKVIRAIKLSKFFWILIIALGPFRIVYSSYEDLVHGSFKWITSYLILSLIYFSYTQDKEERAIVLNMWKIYFSIISLMLIFLYSLESNIRNVSLDFQKTKLSYELQLKLGDSNLTFNEYNNTIQDYLKSNQNEKVPEFNETKPIKEVHEPFLTWYGNFAFGVINIITWFMFLWSIVELKIFNSVQKQKPKYIEKLKSKNLYKKSK